jgi:hypothetical protein
MSGNDCIIDISCEWSNDSVFNPKRFVSQSHLLAYITLKNTFFELSLKNDFAVLSHPLIEDCHFPQNMSIIEIMYDYFGNVLINADDDSIYVPVSQKPFCHITIE